MGGSDDQVVVELIAQTSGYVQGMKDTAAQTTAAASSVKRSFDSLGQSATSFMAIGRQVDAALQSEIKNLADVAARTALYNTALKASVMTQAEYSAAMATVTKAEQALTKAREISTVATKAASVATHDFSLMTAGAQRELGVLAGEAIKGNWGQFEKSMITLGRQSGLMRLAFSATGLSVIGLGAAVVGVASIFVKSEAEVDDFNKTLLLTGGYAGQTALQMVDLRNQIGASTGKYGDATDALKELAASGRITGDTLKIAAQGAVDFATLSGESAEKAAKAFEAIAKDPTKAIDELNQQYHFLSAAQYEHIQKLQEEGDKTGAAEIATKAFAAALADRVEEYKKEQGLISKGWDDIKSSIGGAIAESKAFFQGLGNLNISDSLGKFFDQAKGVAFGSGSFDFYAMFHDQVSPAIDEATAKTKALKAQTAELAIEGDKDIKKIVDQYGKAGTAAERLQEVNQRLYEAYKNGAKMPEGINFNGPVADQAQGPLWDQISAKILNTAKSARAYAQELKSLAKVQSELDNDYAKSMDLADSIAQQYSGPVAAAYNKTQKELGQLGSGLDDLDAKFALHQISADQYAAGYDKIISAAVILGDTFDDLEKKQAALNKMQDEGGDAVERLFKKYQEEADQVGMTDHQRTIANDNLKIEKEVRQAIIQAIKEGHPEYAEQYDELVAQAEAHNEVNVAIKESIARQKEYVSSIEGSGLDALKQFTDALSGAGDGFDKFGDKLKQDAKQLVSELLFTFLKLNVLGPFFAGLFGQSSGFFGQFGGGGGSMMSMIPAGIAMATGSGGTAGGAGAGGSAGGPGGIIGQGYQAYQMYQNGWGGIGQGLSNIFGTNGGSGHVMPGSSYFGSSVYGPGMDSYYAPTGLGYGVAVAGGLYAGYNRYQQGGALGGLAGGATYAIGGTALGLGLGSLAAGGTFGAGVGAMAGGASAMGASAGVAAAIPVIGWIALAAMIVDMVSGGKLFGTDANKFVGGNMNYNVKDGAFGIDTNATFKGQKALFGGSFYKEKAVDTPPEVIEAFQKYFDNLNKIIEDNAKTFGLKATSIIDAQFQQTFDKKGNVTGGTTTIGGETFTEDLQHFMERVDALSRAGNLDQLGVDVTGYVNQFKQDADQMAQAIADATQFLTTVQTDLSIGTQLLTGQDTIKAVWDYVQEMQKSGETLTQTYQGLMQAAQQYNQIMDTVNQGIFQAESGNDPAAQFAAAVAGIDVGTDKMIAQLNAAAIAAGLEGAREEDLAKVHKYAAIQVQQAIATLQSAGASLVDSLYGTGTLDGINSTISAIESAYSVGTSALGGFGNAMTETAQRATDAMNLLLGSLSPYNDEQKLQFALQGFYKGQVTKEQVLEIGQRLYATGQQYKDLFDMLQNSRGGVSSVSATHAGGGTGPRDLSGTHGLTPADLKDLYAQRDAIQAQQRAMQANQLAATVAQLSNAQGKSYEDVAKELNFNLKDLAKDLGVKLEDLPDFLDKLKEQENKVPDTITSNTDRVVDILKKIFTAVGGNPDDLTDDPTDGGDTSTGGTGHSGHARPGATGAPPPPGGRGHSQHGDGTADAINNLAQEQRRTNDYLMRMPTGGDNRGIRTPAAR